ncbi:ZIP family metal transporter [Candidatus Pacearchaeota archaeon]|nr:ZIP family metal transporter [Candidatus Pacearchaeota archaeon]
MASILLYSLVSVILVSLISFIGLVTLSIKTEKLKLALIYLISFSAGALLGDAFIHLVPEIMENGGYTLNSAIYILIGILIFFGLEKIIHWQHCHMPINKEHIHPFAYTNLVGDALHNFIDGLIIAASYMASIPVGLATTIAVILHEIPQEIGDFGVLLHGGFTKTKALAMNFLTALGALLGALVASWLGGLVSEIQKLLIPLAIGGFIYIAGSDLIPELHKETRIGRSIGQIISIILGIAIMAVLLLLE